MLKSAVIEPLESRVLYSASPVATFDSQGLSSLSYNGVKLFNGISNPYDRFNIFNWTTQLTGQWPVETTYGYHAYTTSWNAAQKLLTWNFSWGNVQTQYTVLSDRLDMTITIHNTSNNQTLNGLNIFPMALRFSKAPSDITTYPVTGGGTNAPAVAEINFGSGKLAFCNDQSAQPLYVGYFPEARGTEAMLRVGDQAAENWDNVSSMTPISRPVAPGKSDQYQLSLRFAPASTPTATMAADVYQSFAASGGAPATATTATAGLVSLNSAATAPYAITWSDRRAIANLNIPSGPGTPNNPNGWFFNDPAINIHTAAGLQALDADLNNYAVTSIAIARQMHAQGVIVWDVEGKGDTSISYVGDPRLVNTLAPELNYNSEIDNFFAMFRSAGLRVGVTIRPDTVQFNGSTPVKQVMGNDPTSTMISKISYAKQRWGATLFYIDSNATSAGALSTSVMRPVAAAFPDSLIIPEHATPGYYGFSGPYVEVDQGIDGTDPNTRAIYPNAFSVINIFNGESSTMPMPLFNNLVTSVRQGDILLYQGSFNDPLNVYVQEIYATAAAMGPLR